MRLMADSGATKTTWCIVNGLHTIQTITTDGINPFFQTRDNITQLITKQVAPHLPDTPLDTVHFYGAGCTPHQAPIVQAAIAQALNPKTTHVQSDLLGAAYATCGNQAGIVAILGTGANSAQYDGKQIVQQTPALGYILGDEGSGAVLGRKMLNLLLKNQLNSTIKEDFEQNYQLSQAQIIEKTYRGEFPNRFLASFAPFVAKHIDHPVVQKMVKQSFSDFVQKNLLTYTQQGSLPTHFVGSIAYHFQDLLKEVLTQYQLPIGTIQPSPIEGIVRYHQQSDKTATKKPQR